MGQVQGNAKQFPPPVPFGQSPTMPVLQQAQQVQMAPQQQFVDQNAIANQAFYGAQPKPSVADNQGVNPGINQGINRRFPQDIGYGRPNRLMANIE